MPQLLPFVGHAGGLLGGRSKFRGSFGGFPLRFFTFFFPYRLSQVCSLMVNSKRAQKFINNENGKMGGTSPPHCGFIYLVNRLMLFAIYSRGDKLSNKKKFI